MDDFNPFAAPEIGLSESRLASEADEGRGVWRDGNTLVMVKIARLPSRCVRCNEPATSRLKRSLSWHHPAIYLVVLLNLLIYLIVALLVRKTAKIEVPVCEEHRASRKKGILFGWIIALAGIALCFGVGFVNDDQVAIVVIAGIVLIVVGLIFGVNQANVVTPAKIDDTHVWLKKVSPLYLLELPPLPYSEEAQALNKIKVRMDEL